MQRDCKENIENYLLMNVDGVCYAANTAGYLKLTHNLASATLERRANNSEFKGP